MSKYLIAINSEFVLPAQVGIKSIFWKKPTIIFIKLYHHFMTDSLYKNSIYLMLSTAVQSFFGFFFWIIVAHLYNPEEVGISTTLISVMTLIGGFSTLGFNVGLVRYLPNSKEKNEKINSSFFITILASVLISIIFITGLKTFSPKLIFLQTNLLDMVLFVLFASTLSVNTLIESVFIAYRSAKYTLLKNTVLSIVKVIFPVFLLVFSAYGIFESVGFANIIAFGLSVGILMYNFKYQPKISINLPIVKKIGSYSFANYIAVFLNTLPQMLLPLIIINKLGAKESAYFYIAMMIANLIFIIPIAISQSLFAEGTYDGNLLKKLVFKAFKITLIILLPTVLIIVIFGDYILLAFGKQYSSDAFKLMQLFAISSLFLSMSNISSTILRIKNKLIELIGLGLFSAGLILILSYLYIGRGLLEVGYVWLFSQILVALICLFILLKYKMN